MSLLHCPECGHEISNAAVACPNCGRPVSTPIVERKVVVANPPRHDYGFPKWAFIPIGIIGAVILFVLFVMMRNENNANTNVNVDLASRRTGTTVQVPPATDAQTVTAPAPQTSMPQTSMPSSQSSVPGSQTTVTNTKGTVVIDAKITTGTGQPQAVRNERFYLLDKDIEMILGDARIDPIDGQTLLNSFGLSVMYPSRYGDFHSAALKAMSDHVKYSGITDGSGKTQINGVEPSGYYLFGVTKTAKGFAVWSAPVSINAGQNDLNLSPQRVTEIETGE